MRNVGSHDTYMPSEGRISYYRVKPGVVAVEDLGKFDLPVEGRQRGVGLPPLLQPVLVFLGAAFGDG